MLAKEIEYQHFSSTDTCISVLCCLVDTEIIFELKVSLEDARTLKILWAVFDNGKVALIFTRSALVAYEFTVRWSYLWPVTLKKLAVWLSNPPNWILPVCNFGQALVLWFRCWVTVTVFLKKACVLHYTTLALGFEYDTLTLWCRGGWMTLGVRCIQSNHANSSVQYSVALLFQ